MRIIKIPILIVIPEESKDSIRELIKRFVFGILRNDKLYTELTEYF